MIVTEKDIEQFQYLLPVQGNMKTLELVEGIVELLQGTGIGNDVKFSREQIDLLKSSVKALDENCRLSLPSLPLVRKILEEQ